MTGKRSKGSRSKTRHKLKKREKRATVNRLLEKPPINSTVQIDIDSSVHKGMPHPRFQGLSGKVIAYRGSSAEVKIRHGNKEKVLVVHPIHLKILEVGGK